MAIFGITNEGFAIKRLADIRKDMVDALASVEDPVSGEKLTPSLADEDDPLIQIVNAFSDALADAWEQLQLVYNQFDPLKATGVGLSGVVQLNGLRRRSGSKSSAILRIDGDPGTVISKGRRVTTVYDTPVFEVSHTVTIEPNGHAYAKAECEEEGPFEAPQNTLVKILTPVSGWSSVTNSVDAITGTYEETDEELRARQQISTSNTGQTIVEAIASGIGALEGVLAVKVYQNIDLVADLRGIPGKSIAVLVLGGDDGDIARMIFSKLAAGGADTHGTITRQIVDEQGIQYPVRFSRPTHVDIYVEVNVEVVDAALWPTDGASQIIEAILLWAESGGKSIGVYKTYDQDGYSLGQSVYASELFIPAYIVPGAKVASINIDDVGDSSAGISGDSVDIAWDEIASFKADNITVLVN